MYEKFEIGEVAFVVPFEMGDIDIPGYWCTEVTVTGPLQPHWRSRTGDAYPIRTHDGREVYASPCILRKKLPPSELGQLPREREVAV